MADFESIGVLAPVIDARNEEELYQQALRVVLNRSRGQLNDTSDSNPLGVLLRAQAFASAELLYAVNKLPIAFAIKHLELTGVVRRLGQKATVNLTFYLTAPRSVAFTIPQNFQVSSTGGKVFLTDAVLTIPARATSGTIQATAENVGESYNLPSFTITQFTQPLAFLASVSNANDSQGGADAETAESAIARGLIALRASNPVSPRDFEVIAETVMGSGSRAKAIGLLGPDRETEQKGAIHVFCLSPSGPANDALQREVFVELSQRILLGTSAYVSPMEQQSITAVATIKLEEGADPTVVADSLWEAFLSYLSPASFEPGEAVLIQEVSFSLRFIAGVDFIDGLTLNGTLQNVPMPNDYTLPLPYSLTIDMIDATGNSITQQRGAGEDESFDPQI